VCGSGAHELTVSLSGTGNGRVISDVGGIGCGPLCTAQVSVGDVLTFTADPDASSRFTGWVGACSGMADCTITVEGDIQLGAGFNAARPLNLSFGGNGGGRVTSIPAGADCTSDCVVLFDADATVTLTATPTASSRFGMWGQSCQGTAGASCGITLGSSTSVAIDFIATHEVAVAPTGTGVGTATSSPSGITCGATCSDRFDRGATVTLVGATTGKNRFSSWISGPCAGATPPSCTFSVTEDVVAVPSFAARQTLTINVIGQGQVTDGGAVSCASPTCQVDFDRGATTTLVPAAADGWRFDRWEPACPGFTCDVVMSADLSIDAVFVEQHLLSIDFQGTGAGSVAVVPPTRICISDCTILEDTGAVVVLTATAAAGSRFGGWTGACSTNPCTVTMTGAKTAGPTFVKTQLLTASVSGNGRVTSNVGGLSCPGTCSVAIDTGTAITLSADADPGARFGSLDGAASNSVSFTVTVDRVVPAVFLGGARLWSRVYGGTPSFGREAVNDLAIDASGAVFVIGTVSGETTINFDGINLSAVGTRDVMIVKYTAAGVRVWARMFTAGVGTLVLGGSLATLSNGDLVVGGYFSGTMNLGGGNVATSAGGGDAFVARLDGATGTTSWLVGFGSPGEEMIRGLAVDPADRIVLLANGSGGSFSIGSGSVLGLTGQAHDVIAKLAPDGTHLWSRLLLRTQNADNQVSRVLATDDGDVIAVGSYSGFAGPEFGGGALPFGTRTTFFIVRVAASTGAHVWSRAYGGIGPGGHTNNTRASDAAIDPAGRIVVAGWFDTFGDLAAEDVTGVAGSGLALPIAGANDMFVATYDATAGDHISSYRLGSSDPDSTEIPIRIAISESGDVSMLGTFQTPGFTLGPDTISGAGGSDLFFLKLSSAGVPRWLRGFGGPSGEFGTALAVSGTGQVSVGGFYGDHTGGNTCSFDGTPFGSTDEGFLITLGP